MLCLLKVKMDPFSNILSAVCCTSSVYLTPFIVLPFKDTCLDHFPKWHLRKSIVLGAPGWLSQLSIQLLISAEVLISESWVQALRWAPGWVGSLLKKKEKEKKKHSFWRLKALSTNHSTNPYQLHDPQPRHHTSLCLVFSYTKLGILTTYWALPIHLEEWLSELLWVKGLAQGVTWNRHSVNMLLLDPEPFSTLTEPAFFGQGFTDHITFWFCSCLDHSVLLPSAYNKRLASISSLLKRK